MYFPLDLADIHVVFLCFWEPLLMFWLARWSIKLWSLIKYINLNVGEAVETNLSSGPSQDFTGAHYFVQCFMSLFF